MNTLKRVFRYVAFALAIAGIVISIWYWKLSIWQWMLSHNQVADWLTAIGTLLAVFAALFIETGLKWIRRPRLKIHVTCNPPDCHKTTWYTTPCYYYRIKVENKGLGVAERVEVYAAKLYGKAEDRWQKVELFLPLDLKWSSLGIPILPILAPDMERYCDIGHIIEPHGLREMWKYPFSLKDDNTKFFLETEVEPNTGSHILEPGKYRLELWISAANFKPIKRTLEIFISGKWYDDENEMISTGASIAQV